MMNPKRLSLTGLSLLNGVLAVGPQLLVGLETDIQTVQAEVDLGFGGQITIPGNLSINLGISSATGSGSWSPSFSHETPSVNGQVSVSGSAGPNIVLVIGLTVGTADYGIGVDLALPILDLSLEADASTSGGACSGSSNDNVSISATVGVSAELMASTARPRLATSTLAASPTKKQLFSTSSQVVSTCIGTGAGSSPTSSGQPSGSSPNPNPASPTASAVLEACRGNVTDCGDGTSGTTITIPIDKCYGYELYDGLWSVVAQDQSLSCTAYFTTTSANCEGGQPFSFDTPSVFKEANQFQCTQNNATATVEVCLGDVSDCGSGTSGNNIGPIPMGQCYRCKLYSNGATQNWTAVSTQPGVFCKAFFTDDASRCDTGGSAFSYVSPGIFQNANLWKYQTSAFEDGVKPVNKLAIIMLVCCARLA